MPGHVAQRRGAGPALGQRAGGLALEVEHHPAGLGPHHLAQVVVAVHPLRRHRLGQLGQLGEGRADHVGVAGRARGRPRWPGPAGGTSARPGRGWPRGRARRCRTRRPGPRGPARSRRRAARPRPAKSPPASAAAGCPRRRTGRARWSRPATSRPRRRGGTGTRWPARSSAPSILVSIHPKGSATWVEPSSARAVATSRSGFGPRGDPAERLEDGRIAEHQAGVALLPGQHQAVQPGPGRPRRSRPR